MDLMQRRRALMMGAIELPHDFRRIKYLEGQGGQYIDTGIIARSGLRAKYEIEFTTTDGIQQILAALDGGNRIYFPYASTGYFRYGYSASSIINTQQSIAKNERYVVEATADSGYQSIIINGVELYRGSNSDTIDLKKTLFLFASNNSTSPRYAYARIYSLLLQDLSTGDILANYIPCVRRFDNKPGMYDTVTRTFKTNAGTGEFAVPT